jgi:uncharacterized protein (DUF1778 family)
MEAASERLVIRVTKSQKQDLRTVAEENETDLTSFVRDAVNEAVADYRERRVFVVHAKTNSRVTH